VSLSPRVLLTSACLLGALSLTAPSTAHADYWRCENPGDGNPHFINDLKQFERDYGKKARKTCRLYMKTGEGTSSGGGRGSVASAGRSGAATARPAMARPDASIIPAGEMPYAELVTEASQTFEIPGELIHAVIRVESNYDPDAVSRAGAQGLMQLMPVTADRLGVADPFDPRANVIGGTRYLRRLANYFDGDIVKTLAAYHAGHRAVAEKDGIPYAATERYVKKVLGYYYKMKAAAPAPP
jgi:hypothetical protein